MTISGISLSAEDLFLMDTSQSQTSPSDVPKYQPQVVISYFDYSIENHFKLLKDIDILCGSCEATNFNETEIARLSNSFAFLREWQDFVYEPRDIKFSFLDDSVKQDVGEGITLTQFSAASVPKVFHTERPAGSKAFEGFSHDFLINVGGSIWRLDWCPKVNENAECTVNSEFVAIAVHPPNSSYHKLGAPLTGRGAIQIWCFLAVEVVEDFSLDKHRKLPKKKTNGETKLSRPRGRPRKYPRKEEFNAGSQNLEHVPRLQGTQRKHLRKHTVIDSQQAEPLAIVYPESKSHVSDINDVHAGEDAHIEKNVILNKDSVQVEQINLPATFSRNGKEVHSHKNVSIQKDLVQDEQMDLSASASSDNRKKLKTWRKHEVFGSFVVSHCEQQDSLESHASTGVEHNAANVVENSISSDIALPRMMVCLAHDGQVAWDLKWRPVNARNPMSKNVLGFLAVLLGNGALEVWEVPHPRALKSVYPANQESIDPRFIKMQPVFRCCTLKCSDRQSIPLTLEWSTVSPYDKILAGCHDGLVVLWKFCISGPNEDTRPLLSFIADTGPIRALTWAPVQSDPETANIFTTSGPRGIKFWDLRDPFRPLWDHALHGITCSLDWLPELRSIFGSGEDGALWLLCLENTGSTKQGLHNFDCSSFAIWSSQASPLTGVVAYCGEEGFIHCFHPTTRYIKDPSRNPVQHFLCGSISQEKSTIVVSTPRPGSNTKVPSLKRSAPFPEARKKKGTLESSVVEPCGGNKANEILVFPPEMVFLRTLRWSPNKSSQKWLCYGGAAGLVRCQEVDFSIFY